MEFILLAMTIAFFQLKNYVYECLLACLYVNHMHAVSRELRAPGTGLVGGCGPSCGCWETSLRTSAKVMF